MKHSKQIHRLLLFLIIVLAGILRFAWLDRFPPSLYTDEADQGYNAYSILVSGRDEHGSLLPVSLRSFGDWKPPLPTLLMVPFVKLLGLNEVAVRLPSAISGVLIVLLTYFLVMNLFRNDKNRQSIALLTSFFSTISPWHILQSRAAMLVIVGLLFLIHSVFLIKEGQKRGYKLILSSICFSLAIYSYYAMRVIVPLIVIFLLLKYRKEVTKIKKYFISSIIVGLFLLLPLLFGFLKQNDVLFGRAKTVSVFYDQGVKLRQWELITQDGLKTLPLITRFFHNNFYLFGRNIVQRLTSHLDLSYLLFTGDQAQPFQIPNMGILYVPDIILFLIGIYILYQRKYDDRNLLTWWIFISLIPASLTFMTPSSNRTFAMITPIMMLISLGLVYLLKKVKFRTATSLTVTLIYTFSLSYFLKQYFIILPNMHADWWNYGWKEVVDKVTPLESCCDDVIVADVNGMPYIYFLFYKKYDPIKYQQGAIRTYTADRFGFEHVEGFGNYLFPNDFEWKNVKDDLHNKTIYVVPANQITDKVNAKKTVYLPNGKPLFKIIQND